MFTIAETEASYVALQKPYKGDWKVYVDGSFNGSQGQMKRRVPMASGWTISDTTGENLVGYGVSAFKTKFTPNSDKSELRSMVAFLESLEESFPEKINRDYNVSLICDNKELIDGLNLSFKDETFSRRFYARHGDDYLRLFYYISVMNLKFEWVKGHSSNKFNRTADLMARKAFRAVTNTGYFGGKQRSGYLQAALAEFGSYNGGKLTTKQLKNIVAQKGTGVLDTISTLWINMEKTEHEGRTFTGFSFTDGDMETQGTKGGVFLSKPNSFYLTVRAVNYALSQYVHSVEKDTTLLIRLPNNQVVGLINTLGRGRRYNVARKNTSLQREVDKMLDFIKDKHVLAMNTSEFAKSYKGDSSHRKNHLHVTENARKAVEKLMQVAHAG